MLQNVNTYESCSRGIWKNAISIITSGGSLRSHHLCQLTCRVERTANSIIIWHVWATCNAQIRESMQCNVTVRNKCLQCLYCVMKDDNGCQRERQKGIGWNLQALLPFYSLSNWASTSGTYSFSFTHCSWVREIPETRERLEQLRQQFCQQFSSQNSHPLADQLSCAMSE